MKSKFNKQNTKYEVNAALKLFAPPSEHDLQVVCVEWFRLQFPGLKNLLFAIPNGGKRNIIVAKKMKEEGVLSGVPDLFLAIAKKDFHGLFIEMKTGKNKPTENQLKMMDQLKEQNYQTVVCFSFEEFTHHVKNYLYD
jgi:hypothetical protein